MTMVGVEHVHGMQDNEQGLSWSFDADYVMWIEKLVRRQTKVQGFRTWVWWRNLKSFKPVTTLKQVRAPSGVTSKLPN